MGEIKLTPRGFIYTAESQQLPAKDKRRVDPYSDDDLAELKERMPSADDDRSLYQKTDSFIVGFGGGKEKMIP